MTAAKFEIVNPADPYSISSTSELHAAAAVILLTEGHFAVRTMLGRVICPQFSLSGEEGVELWWCSRPESKTCTDFFDWTQREFAGIADALETVQLEGPPREGLDLANMARVLARALRNATPQGSRR